MEFGLFDHAMCYYNVLPLSMHNVKQKENTHYPTRNKTRTLKTVHNVRGNYPEKSATQIDSSFNIFVYDFVSDVRC